MGVGPPLLQSVKSVSYSFSGISGLTHLKKTFRKRGMLSDFVTECWLELRPAAMNCIRV